MSKNKKSQPRIKKTFIFEGLVKAFNVMESLFPEFWGKCSFRIRRVLVSGGDTTIYVEAKENEKKSHTIMIAIDDSVGRFEELPEFENVVIGSCEELDGEIALVISEQFVFFGSRIFVFLTEGEEEGKSDLPDKNTPSTSIP